MTLIGSAPNSIVASVMEEATGRGFAMFDYLPHGLSMLGIAALLGWICWSCGLRPGEDPNRVGQTREPSEKAVSEPHGITRDYRVLFVLLFAIGLVSLGYLHPALAFSGAALVMVGLRLLPVSGLFRHVDWHIILFLGSMFGFAGTLEHTGALGHLAEVLRDGLAGLTPLVMIMSLLLFATLLSNAVNNAASAVLLAPLAVGLAQNAELGVAAALMAVAAGSNLTLLIPTHQAVLIVRSQASFTPAAFRRVGLVLTVTAALAASVVIWLVWQ